MAKIMVFLVSINAALGIASYLGVKLAVRKARDTGRRTFRFLVEDDEPENQHSHLDLRK